MKIILSPTKEMKTRPCTLTGTTPLFLDITTTIKKELETYSIEDIHERFGISFALAKKVYQYYHEEFNPTHALGLYSGTAFKHLTPTTYTKTELDYVNDTLCILSAYYGILRPSDLVTPYRLDFLTKTDSSLYELWKQPVSSYFENDPYIISLASKEFEKMIHHPNLIQVDFIEIKAGKHTRNSMHVKNARGAMLDYCIKHQISSIEQFKQCTVLDYSYDEPLSTPTKLVFIRDFLTKK